MIPTYNQEDYILEAIQSALSQNYQNLEVVVCDDCSQDNTWEFINSIKDKRLKVYRNKKNLGRVKNYRRLLYELATGDFVINLDGDDYYIDNSYIKKAVEMIKRFDLDLVFSNQIIGYKNKQKHTNMILPSTIDGNWLFLNYGKKGIHIPHMTALYKRTKAIEMNFYNKNIISSDWESLLRYILSSKVGFISESSGVWRQVEGSQSKVDDLDKYIQNIDTLLTVSVYATEFLDKKDIIGWKNRMAVNLIKDMPHGVISCNTKYIVDYAYNNLTVIEFTKLLLSYRFIGKILLGRCKSKCVE